MIPNQTSLKQIPIHKVLMTCFQTKQTGLLVVENETRKKVVLIENGQPRGCRSNIKQETLGHLLIEEGLINEKQLREVLKEMEDKADGYPLGMTLIRKGMLEQEKLANLLERQLLQRLYDLFTWQEGSVKLKPPGQQKNPEPIPMSINTPTLILQGVMFGGKKNGQIAQLNLKFFPVLNPTILLKLDDFGLKGPQMAFLRNVEGRENIEQLCRTGKLDPEEGKALLYGLSVLGVVKFLETPIAISAPLTSSMPLSGPSARPTATGEKAPQSAFAKIIGDKLTAAERQDYFQLLGVARESSDAEIRKVYFKLAKEFHPDRLRSVPEESARRQGELLFAKFSEAYNTLVDPDKRKDYMATLSIGSDDATAKATKILESEAIFQKARNTLRAGDYRKAKELFDQAIKLHADEPEYQLYMGWCTYKIGAAEKNAAAMAKGKQLIEKNKEARKNIETGFYFLGEIALLENNLNLATQHFNKTLEINPKSHEAERQLRLIEMRSAKKDKGFGGMFKKDKG